MQKISSYGVYFISAVTDRDSIFQCKIELAVVYIMDGFKAICH